MYRLDSGSHLASTSVPGAQGGPPADLFIDVSTYLALIPPPDQGVETLREMALSHQSVPPPPLGASYQGRGLPIPIPFLLPDLDLKRPPFARGGAHSSSDSLQNDGAIAQTANLGRSGILSQVQNGGVPSDLPQRPFKRRRKSPVRDEPIGGGGADFAIAQPLIQASRRGSSPAELAKATSLADLAPRERKRKGEKAVGDASIDFQIEFPQADTPQIPAAQGGEGLPLQEDLLPPGFNLELAKKQKREDVTQIYKCIGCDAPHPLFTDPDAFRKHLREQHPIREADPKSTYNCWLCNTQSSSPNYLVNHYNSTHGSDSQLYGCAICYCTADTQRAIERHMVFSHFRYEYPLCQKKFYIPCDPICVVDGTTYLQRSSIVQPNYQPKEPRKKSDFPYICIHPDCARKEFFQPIQYQEHMERQHQTRRSYPCWNLGCTTKLTTVEGLKSHVTIGCKNKPTKSEQAPAS